VWYLRQTLGQRDPRVIARILKYHNDVRAKHGAAPLAWSSTLAESAQVSCLCVAVHLWISMHGLRYRCKKNPNPMQRYLSMECQAVAAEHACTAAEHRSRFGDASCKR